MTARQLLDEWDRLDREERFPHPRRILVAMALTDELELCRDLLAGVPVDPERLDQRVLFRLQHRRLVRLDMAAIDLLDGPAW